MASDGLKSETLPDTPTLAQDAPETILDSPRGITVYPDGSFRVDRSTLERIDYRLAELAACRSALSETLALPPLEDTECQPCDRLTWIGWGLLGGLLGGVVLGVTAVGGL